MPIKELTNLPPDISATAEKDRIGFEAGWRAAMAAVRRDQMKLEYPYWFVTAMKLMADRIVEYTRDGPSQEESEMSRCGDAIASAIHLEFRR